MANPENLIPFTGADDPRRVNGPPKGTKHLSTHIQDMLNDPDFELKLKDGSILKGAPLPAIIKTAIAKSISGDTRAMDWLAKHGYGTNIKVEVSKSPAREILEAMGLIEDDGKINPTS